MNVKKLKAAIDAVQDANKKLHESLSMLDAAKLSTSQHEVVVDAVIKRFEIAFEYCWKLLKLAAEYQGVEANGPRPAIQEAVRFGWIEDPEFWAEALDARNGSVHDYFGVSRSQYVKLVRKFSKEIDRILPPIKKLK